MAGKLDVDTKVKKSQINQNSKNNSLKRREESIGGEVDVRDGGGRAVGRGAHEGRRLWQGDHVRKQEHT